MIPDRLRAWVRNRPGALISMLLAAATLAVYLRTAWFDFTNYDEHLMVVRNPIVTAGITIQGLAWALTTSYFEYWHPLTWLSHMLDCELFGLWAGGHHLVSVGLHVANVLLLLSFLQRVTGSLGRSAFVAALFALHPLKVESVVWIAERKDVLSAFFFFLTLHAYVRYVDARAGQGSFMAKSASTETESTHPKWRYYHRLGLVAFAGGILVKPMVVTIPFVLLLLDLWPLRRWDPVQPRQLLPLMKEKTGYFVLMLAGCVLAYVSVEAGGSIIDTGKVPVSTRLANVPVTYVRHLFHAFWPTGLMPVYPPETLNIVRTVGALAILVAVSALAWRFLRQAPWFAVGWCLFLGMLVPTIGIVAVSLQPLADRYAYVPTTGIFIAAVWGLAAVAQAWGMSRSAQGTVAAGVAMVLAGLTWVQTGYWRDSVTLWSRCLELHPVSTIALYNKGLALQDSGKHQDAIPLYQETLRLKPDHLDANLNLGVALLALRQPATATNAFAQTLRIQPGYSKALGNMGAALFELGDLQGAMRYSEEALKAEQTLFGPYVILGRCLSTRGDPVEAITYFNQALKLNPGSPQTRHLLGQEYLVVGDSEQGELQLREAIKLAPRWAEPRFRLAAELSRQGRAREAVAEYRLGLSFAPQSPEALNNLAWILATSPLPDVRNGAEAVRLAWAACQLTAHRQPVLIGTLAAAYAEAGDFDKAQATALRAAETARSAGDTNLASLNEGLLAKYSRREAHRTDR